MNKDATWLAMEWILFVLSVQGVVVNVSVFVVTSVLLCRPCCPQAPGRHPDAVSAFYRLNNLLLLL